MKKFYFRIMKTLILSFIASISSSAFAADCTTAMNSIDALIVKTDKVLGSKDYEQVNDVVSELRTDVGSVLKAADICECDEAYYSAEELADDVKGAYTSDDISEAKDYLSSSLEDAQLTKTHIQSCGVLLSKQSS